jgi:DNA-binding beta-propeller fold protein YncE
MTDTPGTPIFLGFSTGSNGIAITPNGDFAYVVESNVNRVRPIDLMTDTPGTPIAVGVFPQNIAITSDGTIAYVTNRTDNTVTPIDLSNDMTGTPIAVGNGPDAIAIASISVYNIINEIDNLLSRIVFLPTCDITDTHESKLCALDMYIRGTQNSKIDTIIDLDDTIDSKVDVIDNEVEQVQLTSNTIESKVCALDSKIDFIIQLLLMP